MIHASVAVALTCRAPIVTRSSEPSRWGVDIPFARDANGNAIIPGSHIKGHLSDALACLAQSGIGPVSLDMISAWFGGTDEDTELQSRRNTPHRGQLAFSDFVGPSLSGGRDLRYRVARDPRTGAAARHALAVVESPWSTGLAVTFKGSVHFVASDPAEVDRVASAVRLGLCWVPQLGSQKSVGFGEILGVEVAPMPPTPVTPATSKTPQSETKLETHFTLVLNPESPFCLAKPRSSENVFDSETTISGAVIRGCVAEAWRQVLRLSPAVAVQGVASYVLAHRNDPRFSPWVALAEVFDRIVFRHAFPSPAKASGTSCPRAVFPSVSIGYTGDRWFDYALQAQPDLRGGKAPAFSPDWKPDVGIWGEFGWAVPKRELRVRTAISEDSGTAKDSALFGYEMVNPTGCVWVGELVFPVGTDENRHRSAWAQLVTLLSPRLGGLGKTKAQVRVTAHPGSPPRPVPVAAETTRGEIIVTLQTAALLANPRKLVSGAGVREALLADLKLVWSELSDRALSLKRFFARQSLAGGPYLWRRFQFGRPYNPWLLTDAGSVFVFERTKAAEDCLRRLSCSGLQLPEWVRENYQPDAPISDWRATAWRWCPFVPESGFGEIAMDLDCRQHVVTPQPGSPEES